MSPFQWVCDTPMPATVSGQNSVVRCCIAVMPFDDGPVKRRTDAPAALDHVLYEMEMLAMAVVELSQTKQPEHVRSGWIEVFAIHARNLNEFFGGKPGSSNYMHPTDFLNDWDNGYILNKKLKGRASAQVAHLTYSRERPEEKTDWPVVEIFVTLRAPCMAFLKVVAQDSAVMGYKLNLERTTGLLSTLPRLIFADPVAMKHMTSANSAPAQSLTVRLSQVTDNARAIDVGGTGPEPQPPLLL